MVPPDGPEFGAAQPIVGPAMGFMRKAKGLYDRLNQPGLSGFQRPDTTRMDDMVRKANESFRQAAAAEDAKKAAAAAAKPPVKRVPKRAPVRTLARPAARR